SLLSSGRGLTCLDWSDSGILLIPDRDALVHYNNVILWPAFGFGRLRPEAAIDEANPQMIGAGREMPSDRIDLTWNQSSVLDLRLGPPKGNRGLSFEISQALGVDLPGLPSPFHASKARNCRSLRR